MPSVLNFSDAFLILSRTAHWLMASHCWCAAYRALTSTVSIGLLGRGFTGNDFGPQFIEPSSRQNGRPTRMLPPSGLKADHVRTACRPVIHSQKAPTGAQVRGRDLHAVVDL